MSITQVLNFAYIVESINLWHDRLGFINIAFILRLRKMELIPMIKIDDFLNILCVEEKHAKKPFKSVISTKT